MSYGEYRETWVEGETVQFVDFVSEWIIGVDYEAWVVWGEEMSGQIGIMGMVWERQETRQREKRQQARRFRRWEQQWANREGGYTT